ncbi:MAG: type III secretion inner membrane ring lipoprotein SctJ [Pseudomonadota bacterium]|nr:type III secretion inner membrane ring lipoprotein SctJ [Pseudomonadota bacterium]
MISRLKHILTALVLACALAACSGQELYRDIEEREANEMVSVLMRAGIESNKVPGEKGAFTVEVAQADFARAVDVLRHHGLPRQDFETLGTVFEKEGFTSSSLAERARLVFGTSQELSNTISQFDGVIEARVHLALPEADALTGTANPPSASVFVKYREGMDLPAQTAAIKSLVTNSIEGLDYNKVSVAMTEAKPLPVVRETPVSDVFRGTLIPLASVLGILLLVAAAWRFVSLRNAGRQARAMREEVSAQLGDFVAGASQDRPTDHVGGAKEPAE